mgnify:CR=1 FL=1
MLHSLAFLRESGHELIVVDGGSSDTTVAEASGLADKVVAAPKGRASQMNAGARVAKGEIFWFLHADTLVPSDAAKVLLERVAKGREWGRFDIRLSGGHWLLRVVERMMKLRSRLSGIATGDQGIFVTRGTFEAIGGFPEIPLMEDIALSKMLIKRSAPVCISSPRLITSSRRWEERGIVRTILLMWRFRMAYALGTNPEKLVGRYHP